jgi:anti-sigma-K factor RskA
MVTERHFFDELPAYALGSLDKEEAQQVRQHLDGCSVCRAELVAYQNVTEQIGLAAPQIEPPAELRQKVLARAGQSQKAAQVEKPAFNFSDWIRSWITPWRFAAFLLVLALAVGNLFFWSQSQQAQTGFRTIRLAGTSVSQQAVGMIVISREGEYGTLVVDHLKPLDAQHQYQLWLIKDGLRTSGGVFSVNDSGYNSLLVYSPSPLSSYNSFGITVEPVGGSPGPTGPKVLGGSL